MYKNIPNLRKIGHSYSSKLFTDKNKGSELINYCTEKKIGKIYTNQIKIYNYNDNKSDKNKIQTCILSSKNRNTPISSKKRIQIESFNWFFLYRITFEIMIVNFKLIRNIYI